MISLEKETIENIATEAWKTLARKGALPKLGAVYVMPSSQSPEERWFDCSAYSDHRSSGIAFLQFELSPDREIAVGMLGYFPNIHSLVLTKLSKGEKWLLRMLEDIGMSLNAGPISIPRSHILFGGSSPYAKARCAGLEQLGFVAYHEDYVKFLPTGRQIEHRINIQPFVT